MRTFKTVIASLALVALALGTADAGKKKRGAVVGGKLIKAKENKEGRQSMLIGLSPTQKSALLMSYNNDAGRDDFNVWRLVFKSSKVPKNYVRKASPYVEGKLLSEMASKLNLSFRLRNGRFADSDFQKATRTRNKAGKLVKAVKFVQTSQRGKTGRVGYAYPSTSRPGYLSTKIVDYKNGRRVSRFNRTKYSVKSFK